MAGVKVDLKELRRRLLDLLDPVAVIGQLEPLRDCRGGMFEGENHDSLKVWRKDRRDVVVWQWFSRGLKGNVLDFIALHYFGRIQVAKGEWLQVLKKACDFAGLEFEGFDEQKVKPLKGKAQVARAKATSSTPKKEKANLRVYASLKEAFWNVTDQIRKGGKGWRGEDVRLSNTYMYRDKEGAPVFAVLRWEYTKVSTVVPPLPSKRLKTIRYASKVPGGWIRAKREGLGTVQKMPLYGLEDLV